MSEPTLESISDYDTLSGEKKKVIWIVVIVGLMLGVIYSIVSSSYKNVDDAIQTQQTIKVAPKGTMTVPVK